MSIRTTTHAVTAATALANGTGVAAIAPHAAYAKANVPQPILTVVSLVTLPVTVPNENETPPKITIPPGKHIAAIDDIAREAIPEAAYIHATFIPVLIVSPAIELIKLAPDEYFSYPSIIPPKRLNPHPILVQILHIVPGNSYTPSIYKYKHLKIAVPLCIILKEVSDNYD